MKIKAIIDKENEDYFNDVSYSLDDLDPDGELVSISRVINYCLEECRLFEAMPGMSVTDYMMENYPEDYARYIEETSKDK